MTLLRILDLACSLFGWHDNPFDRELDRRWWADLEADYPDPHGWLADWHQRISSEGATPLLLDELIVHKSITRTITRPEPLVSYSAPVRRPAPQSVEGWRPLVAEYFPAEHVDAALRVMACESEGNPNAANPSSSARGLFQFLRSWWSGAWGYPAFDPFDPVANVKAAAWLSAGGTDWGAWECRHAA